MEQEILVHHEKRLHFHVALESHHHLEQLVTRLIEIRILPFRGRAEVATDGAAHRGDQRCRDFAVALGEVHAHRPRADARVNLRMADRLVDVFAKKLPEPSHPFAAHHMVSLDPLLEPGNAGNMPAHDDLRIGEMLVDELAHGLDLPEIGRDRADAHNVVRVSADLLDEPLEHRKIEQGAGGRNIRLDEHEPPGAMEHAQGKRPLLPRHLVVVELHRIDGAATVFIVLGIRSKNARE